MIFCCIKTEYYFIKIFYIFKLVTDLNNTLDLIGNVEDITV
jgi:hypothetical protein